MVVVEEEDGHGAGHLAGDEAEDDGEEGPAVPAKGGPTEFYSGN